MTYGKLLCAASLLLATCGSRPTGVLVDIGSWPEGAVLLQVAGTLNGTPSVTPLNYPTGTTKFVVYVPEGKSGLLALAMTALDGNGCPRASADAQIEVNSGLRAIVQAEVGLTPAKAPYCPAPQIQEFTPALGPTAGGDAFTLHGQHILPGATVTIAGIPVPDLTMASPTTLSGSIPEADSAFGFVPVVLRNPDGQTAIRSDLYAYYSSRLRFPNVTSFSTGKNPTAVVAGDWNGDHQMDLAVSNGESSVSVLIGDGQGGFGPATNIVFGSNLASIAAGDFNNDKKPDLVVISYGSNSAKLLLNDGKGRFTPGSDILEQLGIPGKLTVADVNADNLLDLVVPCSYTSTVNVLLGTGLGSFSASGAFAAMSNPHASAVGDFDGDSRMDIAVANAASGNLSILLGNGQGQFSAAPVPLVTVGNTPASAMAGDVNEDRKLDLVVVNTADSSVSVLLGDGSGGFASAKHYAAGNTPHAVVLADMNGDRHLDLAIPSSGDNTVRVLLGDGTGRFGQAVSVPTGSNPRALAVADVYSNYQLAPNAHIWRRS